MLPSVAHQAPPRGAQRRALRRGFSKSAARRLPLLRGSVAVFPGVPELPSPPCNSPQEISGSANFSLALVC